ncbi:hypothetical protein Tco_1146576 [Tanacetum coccineum]
MFLKEMMSVILISVHISLNVQVYLSLMGNKIERKGHCVLWGSDVLDEIQEKINENLIKFQDDEKLLQLKQRMKDIFKEPDMPEYLSSSSSKSDDDNNDGSQLADENEDSYRKETHSHRCYEQKTGTSKKDEADNNKEEGMANKKLTNQKRNEEINPFDDPKFGEYYIQHLLVPTQTSAEKKKDQTDEVNWDSSLENEEEIIRKGSEFSTEIRKKTQQQEQEQKIKGKKEKDQIGSSSQESPVFGIDNSLQDSQLKFDLGASPTYEKMKVLIEKKKKMGLKSKYVNKTADPAVELTEDEKLLGRSIFSTQEEEEEEVFNDNEGLILFRMNVQSLAPGKAVIIDNSESDATYEGKYKDIVEFVLYEGSTAAQWKTGLLPENDKNHRMQMDNLRSRIATKILLHEVNIYHKKMSDYAKNMTEPGEGGSNRQ